MSDLTGVNDTLPVRLGGISSTSGLPDYYADVLSTGQLKVAISDASGTALNSTSNALDVYLTNSTIAVTQSGTWTVQQGTPPWSITGTLTNNNTTPAATNIGALVAIAESTLSSSRYTNGDQVLLVTDLAGNTNIDLQYYLGSAISKTNPIATTISDGTNVITAAISAYGTAPTGTEVMGVNAYITNIPTVNQGTSPWITKDQSDGPVTPGTVASFSQLIGGQYNTTLPTLTTTEQSAVQLDSSGRLIISPLTNASIVKAQLQDNSGNGLTSTTVGSTQALDVDVVLSVTDTDITTSGTIAASGATVTISINGCSSLNISITGTWVATLQFQGQAGDGTWYSISVSPNTGGQCVTSTTTNGLWAFGCGGFTQVRMDCSAYTSGTADIRMTASAGDSQTLATDAANNQQVVGNVASLTTDSGNPVKVGSVYNSTMPAPTSGERVDLQSNQFGEVAIQFRNKSTVVTAEGATTVKSGSGRLHGIILAQNSGTTVTIYNNTAASGTIITEFTAQASTFLGPLGIEFSTGLTVDLSASDRITIIYQ